MIMMDTVGNITVKLADLRGVWAIALAPLLLFLVSYIPTLIIHFLPQKKEKRCCQLGIPFFCFNNPKCLMKGVINVNMYQFSKISPICSNSRYPITIN